MSTEQYYRVGQVAEALRLAGHQVSEYQVRKLCDAGMIKTVIIQGQRRIPVSECERLIREGPPMIPEVLDDEPRLPARRRPMAVKHVRHRAADELLAPPSAGLVTSTEQRLMSENQKAIAENQATITGHEATIARNLVEKRMHERELEAEAAVKHQQQAALESEHRRVEWEREWLKYAIGSLPNGARGEYEPAVVKGVKSELRALNPNDDDGVVQSVIDASIGAILKDWYWMQDAKAAVDAGEDSLPASLKNFSWQDPTECQKEARRAAADAITQRPDCRHLSRQTMRDVAVKAVQAYVAGLKAEDVERQAAHDDERLRQNVRDQVTWSLYRLLTSEEQADAGEAIDREFAKWPRGTRRSKLEAECRRAIAPWSEALARRDEEARQQQAADDDRRMRKNLLSYPYLSFPYSFTAQERDSATASAKNAIDQLPQGTSRQQLEQARDLAVKRFVELHKRQQDQERNRKAAEVRADFFADVSSMYRVVTEMERKGELDAGDFNENWALAQRLVKRIRPAVVNALLAHPELSNDGIKRQIERLVDSHLDDCLAASDRT